MVRIHLLGSVWVYTLIIKYLTKWVTININGTIMVGTIAFRVTGHDVVNERCV